MDKLTNRQNIFLNAALLAAQASYHQGFRLRDVLFFCDLFQNWLENGLLANIQRPHRTQILRWLKELSANGLVKISKQKKQPAYQVSTIGVVSILEILSKSVNNNHGSYFYFIFYFIKNYKLAITELLAKGKKLPPAYELELNRLLDEQELLSEEIKATTLEIQKLTLRIEQADASTKLFETSLRKHNLAEASLIIEKKFPYELNNQKPLSELIGLIPESQRSWELSSGNIARINNIWRPQRKLLQQHHENLQNLKENSKKT